MFRFIVAFGLFAVSLHAGERPQISPADLATKMKSDKPPIVLDVRSDKEFAGGRVPGAVHIPFRQVKKRHAELGEDKARAVVVYCQAGVRAAFAEKDLRKLGFTNVLHLKGDWPDWNKDGRPIEKGEPAKK